ncbi:TonB-dependent receptor [Phocoenobacter uteri]|nr:TonB-dependent receptor [Phocoenobacter uteri]
MSLFVSNVIADELGDINVVAMPDDVPISERKVGESKISAKQIDRQQVSDNRDLVRYETGVTVVEKGRFGSSGYAVRGVDENRVGIMIDGLKQSETLSSQGFKELFEGYGNFNNTRNGVEVETVKIATISKGADSVKSGSGALGGSVAFETKDARDYLIDKSIYFKAKGGYQSLDRQKLQSYTFAGKAKWFDILLINTSRDGHERKNYDYDIYSKNEDFLKVGKEREKVDPYTIERNSTLVKLGFQPNENHRFSLSYDDSNVDIQGRDLSYLFSPVSQRFAGGKETINDGQRSVKNTSERKTLGFSYETFTQTPFWDHAKISYSSQKITNNAQSDEYCRTDNCSNVRNPANLELVKEDGIYKETANGKPLVYKEGDDFSGFKFITDDGKVINDGIKHMETEKLALNCEQGCPEKIEVFVMKNKAGETVNRFEERKVEVKTSKSGKKYGVIERPQGTKKVPASWYPDCTEDWCMEIPTEKSYVIMPKSYGRSLGLYTTRDLNTNVKQLNLDFDKYVSLYNMDHNIKYGGLYSETQKSMVNTDKQSLYNKKWWNKDFYCLKNNDIDLDDTASDCSGSALVNLESEQSSFLIPVKAKNTAVYLGDNIQLNDKVGLDLNYRFDKVNYLPSYNASVPVPAGLIRGIFTPLPCDITKSKWFGGCSDEMKEANLQQNLDELLKPRSYKHHSWNIGLNLDPRDWLRVQFKYANAFRAPTSDEVYMTFKHPSFTIAPNVNLKPEIAKTQEVAFTFYRDHSFITLSAFKTNYDDFIDLVFDKEKPVEEGSVITYPFYQNKNRDSAKVTGFEVKSQVFLGDFYPTLDGFRLGYKFSHQKGRVDKNIPMNAIQPTTSVYSVGYSTKDDKYGADLFIKDVQAKKAKDTYNMYWEGQAKRGDLVKGQPVTNSEMAWRSEHYTILDLIGYAKPVKHLTLSLGIYNLTDKKYMSWDSARSIRVLGTINKINQETGAGIKRFYEAGRNYKFNVSWEF